MQNLYSQDEKDFYDIYYNDMLKAKDTIINFINNIAEKEENDKGNNPVEYCIFRIKSPESMAKKLQKNGLPVNAETAITKLTDAVGIRVICGFLCDVYQIAHEIDNSPQFTTIAIKDYISRPKPNGYRSYHIILSVCVSEEVTIPVEIQIRTISQDSWASLEHQMKYKKDISNQRLIQNELKRCADELASTDISMQTIKELINEFSMGSLS